MAKNATTDTIATKAEPATDRARRQEPEPQPSMPTRAETPETRQLLREAAWRQMFGPSQSKNPFTR